MTLNEAIEHLDETLGDSSRMWSCEECRQEHIQLREWLIELRGLREAHEPRVMKWQEIIDAAPQMPFIWLERKENHDRVFQSILFKTWLWDSTVTIITVMTQGWLFEGYQVEYSKTWRCWNTKPSKEQMEAVKWDE